MKYKFFFATVFLGVFFNIYCRSLNQKKTNVSEAFKEINESFYYNKKPIHPLLIEKFIPSMMSGYWQPKVSSIDILNAEDTNVFFDQFEFSRKGTMFRCHRQTSNECLTEEYYTYTWLGKLDNDIHVVFTEESGGGTLTSYWLHFFRLSLAEAYTPEGEKFPQILLTFVRNYPIGGENDSGEPKFEILKNNKVKIICSNGSTNILEVKA